MEADGLEQYLMRALTDPPAPAVIRSGSGGWRGAVGKLPGIALAGALAAAALELAKIGWFESKGISALTLAIVLGMVVGNTVYPRLASASAQGVVFSKQTQILLGIILDGPRLI